MRLLFAKKEKLAVGFEAPFLVNHDDARRLNAIGYAIFHTVNSFNHNSRKTEDLKEILAWYVDLDGEKRLLKPRLESSPLVPSLVVESKNGYHLYFNARPGYASSGEGYRRIEEGLIQYFGGDEKAKDVSRLLRAPGYFHWKDAESPFMVREIMWSDASYKESVMAHAFPVERKAKPTTDRAHPLVRLSSVNGLSEGLSEKLNSLDNETALEILSGKPCVNYEVFSFHEVSRGRKNILVNGRSTSCFIDEAKRIGAKPGGPTVWQWLKYYGHSDQEVARILREELNL